MKKSMFLLGIAAAALASCTNEEVVEVAQNRAIGFSTFVNNGTRTEVTEVTTDKLTKFYAFGVNANENSGWTDLFDNTEVTVSGTDGTPEDTRYWAVGKEHRFAAYSDGNSKISTNVAYNETNQVLTFSSYTPDNTKDLIAAIPAAIEGTTVVAGYNQKVSLTFEHLLSQVKFTFNNTTDADIYTLSITDLAISDNAIKTATGTYTYNASGNQIEWNTVGGTTGSYDAYEDIDDIIANDGATSSLVIPQGNTDNLKVTFTATLTDGSNEVIGIGNFEATLSYSGTTPSTSNEWEPGYRYNYTATINGSMLHDPDTEDPDETLTPIEFTVDVAEWENTSPVDTPITPESSENGN